MFGQDLFAAAGSVQYREFQQATVVLYTTAMCSGLKALDANLKTLCCVMPSDAETFPAIAEIPDLDVLATAPYWPVQKSKTIDCAVEVARAAKKEREANHKEFDIWHNAWRIPAGR